MLRACPREHRAVVLHAISPISMKLCQFKGSTPKLKTTNWFLFWFFFRGWIDLPFGFSWFSPRKSLQILLLLQSSSKLRSLVIFCLVRSVSNSEARSLASASPSLFIFTEGGLINKPIFVTADNRLKYRAICCCINRSVSDNISGWCRLLNSIFGKSHYRRLPY